ncbi:putative hydrolase of the HAD superfamily [Lachnospiraceae bacterium]|nr:putative hydrolase of the HAD superfamily [Lachnospiraceae bacterium]
MSTKAVIFDLDDTLISEMDYVRSGYRAVAKALSGEEESLKGISLSGRFTAEELYKKFVKLSEEDTKQVFNRFLCSVDIEDSRDNVMTLVRIYREHKPVIGYQSDVPETLKGLRQKGFRLGILSDGYAVTQRNKVEALRAEDDFDVVILTDEIGKDAWKPSPEGFQKAADILRVPLNSLMYVGDNPEKDFYINHTCGIPTARITREDGVYRDREYREGIRETYTLTKLTDLLTIPELQ